MVNLQPPPTPAFEHEVADIRIDMEVAMRDTLTVRRITRGIAGDGQATSTASTFTTFGAIHPISGDLAATLLGLVGDETHFVIGRFDKPLRAGDEVTGTFHSGLTVILRSAFPARVNARDDLWWYAAAADKRRVT